MRYTVSKASYTYGVVVISGVCAFITPVRVTQSNG